MLRIIAILVCLTACVAKVEPVMPPVDAVPLVSRVIPAPFVDEGLQDAGFAAWRAHLSAAVAARDIDSVRAMTVPYIKISFGDDDGLDDFTDRLTGAAGPQFGEVYWQELEAALTRGGFFGETNAFVTGYYQNVKIPESWSPARAFFTGPDPVLVYADPSVDAPVLGSLQNVAVAAVSYTGERRMFEQITLKDGSFGYLRRAELRTYFDYRATFERIDGAWKMVYFLAGD